MSESELQDRIDRLEKLVATLLGKLEHRPDCELPTYDEWDQQDTDLSRSHAWDHYGEDL